VTAAAALASTAAIRERCGNIAAAVSAGDSAHFRIDRSRFAPTARLVADVTRRRYPDLAIPYHSRWRHFEAGGVDRKAELDRALASRSVADRARAQVDLTVVSVLLDAGAGAAWSYVEPGTNQRHARSEGLGVASFRAFMEGAFSSDPREPLRVDGAGLAQLDAVSVARLVQAGAANPLVGVEHRAQLLRRLGAELGAAGRPSIVFDDLVGAAAPAGVSSDALLRTLLARFNAIWLTGQTLAGEPLGDVWPHRHAGGTGATAGRVPFHKLTQWLAYSLFEPFEWAGLTIAEPDALTPLPEYRNGGLLLDSGVLVLADPAASRAVHAVGSELVVEWRALTVALLEELAPLIRAELGRPGLPLACLLEGGTWAAGRELAQQLRGGEPPLKIASDGTVF
jgi:hypothetical protein